MLRVMPVIKTIYLVLLMCLGLVRQDAEAINKQYLAVLPFTHVGVSPTSGIQVHFFMPCGTEYLGLVMRADKSQIKQNTIEMAVLVRQMSLSCVGLPKPHRKVLASLPQVRKVVPLDIPMGRIRYGLARALDLTNRGRGTFGARIVHEDPCGRLMGSVIDSVGQASLRLGVLYGFGLSQKTKCSYRQQTLEVPFLSTQDKLLRPIVVKQQDIEQAYYLRVIASRRISQSDRGIGLNYWKACNESPVGLLLRRDEPRQAMRVGMVVARLFNRKCKTSGKWEHYELSGLKVARNLLPLRRGLRVAAGRRYTVTAPKYYELSKSAGLKTLRVSYTSACRSPVGVLYGKDYAGNLSVGVLQLESLNACEAAGKSYAVTQPVFPVAAQSSKIYPLRLHGFRYF